MSILRDELQQSVRSILDQDERVAGGGFLGIVLGSGLGAFVDCLDELREIPYDSISGFAQPTVTGHSGTLCVGRLEGVTVVVLRGRVHYYEGHSTDRVVHGVRTLVAAGAQAILLTNAAGGVRSDLKVGNLMVIEDHINLTGNNPLIGSRSRELGPLFPDMTRAWEPRLRDALIESAQAVGISTPRGVYAGVVGPSYETPAEVRMIERMGGDVVGMSTVFEAIAIRQMGGRVGGLSVVSNAAAGMGAPGETLDHTHVADAAVEATDHLRQIVASLLRRRQTWWESE